MIPGRCIFVQRPVRSDVVVIAGIGSQDPAQMGFAPDDVMIETLAVVDRPLVCPDIRPVTEAAGLSQFF